MIILQITPDNLEDIFGYRIIRTRYLIEFEDINLANFTKERLICIDKIDEYVQFEKIILPAEVYSHIFDTFSLDVTINNYPARLLPSNDPFVTKKDKAYRDYYFKSKKEECPHQLIGVEIPKQVTVRQGCLLDLVVKTREHVDEIKEESRTENIKKFFRGKAQEYVEQIVTLLPRNSSFYCTIKPPKNMQIKDLGPTEGSECCSLMRKQDAIKIKTNEDLEKLYAEIAPEQTDYRIELTLHLPRNKTKNLEGFLFARHRFSVSNPRSLRFYTTFTLLPIRRLYFQHYISFPHQ